jgi:predicted ATPase/class 3 adenylate cyclase
MPDFILDNYAAGRTSGEFSAIALFVDVTGFSSMTDRLLQHGQHGAEVLASVMRAVLAPLIQSVAEQGGLIADQAGDAFTAIFSLSADPQLTARRALTAAWNIQVRAAEQPVHSTPYGDFPVTVKVGAALGPVAWGILQSESGRQAAFYFRGETIDASARAEQRASAGQIVLHGDLYERVRDQIRAERAGDFQRLSGLTQELAHPLPVEAKEQDVSLVAPFFPSGLQALRLLGEFRQVVYLFVGIQEAEDESNLRAFMDHVFYLKSRYGGLSSLRFGDKGAHLMLLWGAPAAHENDIQRALNFILDLRQRTGGALRAGLTYRIAHAGFIGSDLAEEYAAYGRGPNLAARFMQAAGPGEIWVDDYVAKRAQGAFELEYLDMRAFKGFATLQKVYVLRGRKQDNGPFFDGTLIGRGSQMKQLEDMVGPALRGDYAGLLLVVGEPGVGKSRLVHDFIQRLQKESPDGFQAFVAQTDEILREGLNPFVYWLRRYFDLAPSAPENVIQQNFSRRLDGLIAETPSRHLAVELERTRAFLAALLGVHWPDPLYDQLDPQGRHENALIALTFLLQAESLRRPVILVVEDVHWLDPASLEYLARLHRALTAGDRGHYPLAILATARTGEVSPALEELGAARIELTRLDRPALSALAEAHLGGPISERLALVLDIHSEGNPFFAEQILRYLQERHQLAQDGERWELDRNYTASPLPLDVSAVLVARLDRLAGEVREAVQTAAILGREFEVRLLADMLLRVPQSSLTRSPGPDPEKDMWLAIRRAEEESIWAALDELRYIFRHALLRDTAYQMQVETRRKELHALAVGALEKLYHDDIGPHYAMLAYHADQAALRDKACAYYQKAGEAAAAAYQNIQAVDYYSRALSLTPASDQLARYGLFLAREKVYAMLGEPQQRSADLQELESLARSLADPGREAYVSLRRASYAYDSGDYQASIDLARRSIGFAAPLESWETALAAYGLVAAALYRFGQPELGRQEAEEGLGLARQHGSLLDQSLLYNHLGLIHFEQRRTELATESLQRSLELARQAGDLRAQGRALGNMGSVAGALGDFPAAKEIYEESLGIWRKIGLRSSEANDLANLGWVAGNMGEYTKARTYLEMQLRVAREMGDLYGESYGCVNLSAVWGALGDYPAARRQAEQALALALKIGDRSGQAWALTYLGHSQLALNQADLAAKSYQRALDIRRELAQPVLATEPLAGLARTALADGDSGSAQGYTDEILAFLENSGSLNGTDDPLRVYFACYQVLASAQDPRARSLLETARTQLIERARKIHDPAAQQVFLSQIEVNRLIEEAWANSAAT